MKAGAGQPSVAAVDDSQGRERPRCGSPSSAPSPTTAASSTASLAGRGHELHYLEPRLTAETAPLAAGFPAVCVFVNDQLDAATLDVLAAGGTRLVALRCAGFNNVDLAAAARARHRRSSACRPTRPTPSPSTPSA